MLVKVAVTSKRLSWFKFSDGNIKYKPKFFWKYMTSFRKIKSISIQLKDDFKEFIRAKLRYS
jgi:hypothetical protein